MTVTTRIVRIGNSRGIRVPKLLLDQAALSDEVEIQAEPGRLVVSGVRRPRVGWAVAAQAMHAGGDDLEVDAATPTRFDRSSWKW
jgi:antitoxin MazE